MNKKSEKKQKFKKSTLIIWGMVVFTLLGGGLLWCQRAGTIYAPDKGNVRKKFEDAIGSYGAGFTVRDLGCDNGSSVGLTTYVHCDFYGQNYASYRGDLSKGLREADKRLQDEGWKRVDSSDIYDGVFEGKSLRQLPYERQGVRLNLIFYKDASYFSHDVTDVVSPDDYGAGHGFSIIGVWGQASYWSCRQDQFFELPCIPPREDRSVFYKW